jgi:very-short-patch-repair endonuclease
VKNGGEELKLLRRGNISTRNREGVSGLSYKNRMHPRVSKAEIEVFKALSAAGLSGGMVTQKTIVLKSTVPDFCWLNKRKAVYLDGVQAHSGDKQQSRDEEICELLEAKGWEVLRISYEPPLGKKELQRILESIKNFVGSDDE